MEEWEKRWISRCSICGVKEDPPFSFTLLDCATYGNLNLCKECETKEDEIDKAIGQLIEEFKKRNNGIW